MSPVKPRTMPGVLELLPPEQVAFQQFLDTIRAGYQRFGYVPIETPALEFKDVLLTKTGGETEKQVYLAQSSGARAQGYEADLALRFDLTVPLARYVAEHEMELAFPFRRYQMQRVYRGESAQRGRFREFYQCDVDVVGRDSLSVAYDAEVIAVVARVFTDLAIGAFEIGINNRKVLGGFLAELGIADPERRAGVLREVDKIDKVGAGRVAAALRAAPHELAAPAVDRLLQLVAIEGGAAAVLGALDGLQVEDATFRAGVLEMAAVVTHLETLGVGESCWRLRPSIARGLDYYTGTVCETILKSHPEIGSVCSGGRYDDLASYYTKSRLPGVGVSIGATRLFDSLRGAGLVTPAAGVDVLVTRFDVRFAADAQRIATRLRDAGIATELVLEDWAPKKQLAYAAKRGVRFVVIQGETEHGRGAVALKDMRAQAQVEVAVDALAAAIRAGLGPGPGGTRP